MVKNLIALFMLFPIFLFSGDFTATVNRNQVNLGESLILNLTLKDAAPKGNPAIDGLKRVFLVSSQQQSSNTVIVNGRTTKSTNWKLSLHPQFEGELTIPSIAIETSEGKLRTKPITIEVVRGTAKTNNDSPESDSVSLTTEVSNPTPYKNEPVVYTVRLTSKFELTNIQMQKVALADAIVEVSQEPKIYEKIIDGVNYQVLEFRYFITPLKSGILKIPSSSIQGSIPMKRKGSRRSFFDDDFDPFSMIPGFDRMYPFSLTTEELSLDVQPPIANVIPWIPAKSLKIEEVLNDTQNLRVGEPLTRELKITAEGASSSQLPNLNDLNTYNSSFKIYADKPETGDELSEKGFKSYRKEIYTIIPQEAGSLTLPEISIRWWDVAKKEIAHTYLPARTLEVAPSSEKSSTLTASPKGDGLQSVNTQSSSTEQHDVLFYIIISTLASILLIVLLWAISLQRKIAKIDQKITNINPTQNPKTTTIASTENIQNDSKYAPPPKPPKKDKHEKLPDLNPT